MDELRTTVEVIEELGGNQKVADLTGSTNKAVWNWRGFETFPSNTYVAITEALQSRGKTAPPSLWAMKTPAEQDVS
jgi:hypothetical protein